MDKQARKDNRVRLTLMALSFRKHQRAQDRVSGYFRLKMWNARVNNLKGKGK